MHPLARMLRKAANFVDRHSSEAPVTPATDSAIADRILSFCSSSPDARAYAETHLGRFVRTLELTPKGTAEGRLLEMGAYMQITPLLGELGYGETRGCYLGPLGKTDHKSVTSTDGTTFSCEIDLFNAETDVYPYPDDHFATVVCCELLEHLAEDPMHLMGQVNRILAPGGRLVLSTPNICALRSISSVLNGYHPGLYSQYTAQKGGNAVEPRHAREYAPREIYQLMEVSGFAVEHLETGSYGADRPTDFDWVVPLLKQHGFTTDLREDTIHVVGRKTGPIAERYPAWLYA